jgi:Ca2+-transporting ATPase
MDLQLRGDQVLTTEQLQERLAVDPSRGLSSGDAQERLRHLGANQLTSRRQRPLWLQFLAQFHAPLLYALLITGAVKALTGSLREAVVIWSVTVINAVIGFVQESRAERSIGALALAICSDNEVLRDGQQQRLEAQHLVPGDVVLLSAGDQVPADLRLLQVRNLQLDESSLTGESLPVAKAIAADPADAPP